MNNIKGGLNIRSLHKNYEELKVFLKSLIMKPDAITRTETWKCKIPNLYALEGYNHHLNNCSINKADGGAMYIKSNITNSKNHLPG